MCSLYPCIDEPSRVPSWTFYYLLSCTGWQRVVGSGSCSSEDPCLLWCLFPGEPSSIPVVTKCFFSCSGPSQDLPPVQQTDHLLSLSGKLCLSFSRQDGAAEGQQPLHGTSHHRPLPFASTPAVAFLCSLSTSLHLVNFVSGEGGHQISRP